MRKLGSLFLGLFIAGSTAFAGVAAADEHDRDRDRDWNRNHVRYDDRDDRGRRPEVVVTAPDRPPPDAPRETAARWRGHAWVGGEYQWIRGRYIYVPGHWVEARRGSHWVDGRWVHRGDRYVHIPGHWVRR